MPHSPFRWYVCSVSFFVLGALLYVWCHVRTLSQGEEIASLRAERESLIRKQELLRVQVTGLQKASRIREIAAIELGMRFPEERPNNLYTAPSAQTTLMGRSVSLQMVSANPKSNARTVRANSNTVRANSNTVRANSNTVRANPKAVRANQHPAPAIHASR